MNGLGEVLEQDIIHFLDSKVDPKSDKRKIIREEEFTLFDLQKDYAKELHKALLQDNLHQAKRIYEDFKVHYDAEQDENLRKKKLFPILEELHGKIKDYMEKNKKEKNLHDDLAEFEKMLPDPEMPVPAPPPGAAEPKPAPTEPPKEQSIDWDKKLEDLNNMIFEAGNLLEDDIEAAKDYFHHVKALSDLIPVQYKDHDLYTKMVDLGARIRAQEKKAKQDVLDEEKQKEQQEQESKKHEAAMKQELEAYKKKKEEEDETKHIQEDREREQKRKERAEALKKQQEEERQKKLEEQKAGEREERLKQEQLRKNKAFKNEMKIRQLIRTIDDQMKMWLIPDAEESLKELNQALDNVDREMMDPIALEQFNSESVALQAKLQNMKQEKEQGVMTDQADQEIASAKVKVYEYKPQSNRSLTMTELYTKGLYLFHAHKYDDAIAVFREILRRKPNSLSAKIRIQEAQQAKKTGETYGW